MNYVTGSPFSATVSSSAGDTGSMATAQNILKGAITLYDTACIFFKKLHPLFSIDCGAIVIYNTQHSAVQEAYVSTSLSDGETTDIQYLNKSIQINAVQSIVAEFSFPIIKTAEEWVEEEGANHQLVNGETGYNYHCYIPLEIDNEIIGTLELHNRYEQLSTDCLAFCSNVADLLTDMIGLQLQEPSSNGTTSVDAPQNDHPENTAVTGQNAQALLKLQTQIDQLGKTSTLQEFIDKAGKLFPSAIKNIKQELNELAAQATQMADDKVAEPADIEPQDNYPGIIGSSPGMKKVYGLLDQVAATESTVLILGETGTGKELIARAIHNASPRKDEVMIMVNCAAIPANLIESELFGHEKGAFTGATDKRIGKFELADKGTLFLDEIGEMPLDLQVKLLRALQEQEIERVGGKSTIKVNVRIISATNRDLAKEVEAGLFRRDLYYRLNVFPINLPPLRERGNDVPQLAMYFLLKYAAKLNKQLTGFTQRAINQMKKHSWPGNVREMEHLIERQALLSNKPVLSEIDIPVTEKSIIDETGKQQKIKTIDENERDHIFNVLQLCKGRVSGADGAAKLLGVPPTTLNSKIKRLGLNKKHF